MEIVELTPEEELEYHKDPLSYSNGYNPSAVFTFSAGDISHYKLTEEAIHKCLIKGEPVGLLISRQLAAQLGE